MTQLKSFFVPVILLGAIILLIFAISNKTSFDATQDGTGQQAAEPTLPPGLLSCNSLTSAEQTESFKTCLELAEQGYANAQRKIAWAFTREGNYQDWQQAFVWLKRIARFDNDMKLLSQIVLFVLGDSETDKIKAERNIRRLADLRFAPAEAYLAIMYYLNINTLPRDANPAWLLRKAYDQGRSMVTPYDMATIYVNGFGTRPNTAKAKHLLVQYANDQFPVATNNVAWFLATLDENPITSAQFVIELAKSAVDDQSEGSRYTFVDTLAASYAANGNFDRAVNAQQQAIDMLNLDITESTESTPELDEFEARLALYQKGERPILDSLDIQFDVFFKRLKRNIEGTLLNRLNVRIDPNDIASDRQTADPVN